MTSQYELISKVLKEFTNAAAGMASVETLAGSGKPFQPKKLIRKKNRKKNREGISN